LATIQAGATEVAFAGLSTTLSAYADKSPSSTPVDVRREPFKGDFNRYG